MKDKLGLYVSNLMATIIDDDERYFSRKLALNELQKINHDIGSFLIKYDEVLNNKPEMKIGDKNYKEYWTCDVCKKPTHKIEYENLSGTDHLSCVLREEMEEKQLEFNFGDKNENK